MQERQGASKASAHRGLTVDDAETTLRGMRSTLPVVLGLVAWLAAGCPTARESDGGRLALKVDRLLDNPALIAAPAPQAEPTTPTEAAAPAAENTPATPPSGAGAPPVVAVAPRPIVAASPPAAPAQGTPLTKPAPAAKAEPAARPEVAAKPKVEPATAPKPVFETKPKPADKPGKADQPASVKPEPVKPAPSKAQEEPPIAVAAGGADATELQSSGRRKLDAGDLTGAITDLRASLQLRSSVTTQTLLGRAYFDHGDLALAAKALAAAGNHDEAMLLLGNVYQQQGKTAQARKTYEAFLKVHPDHKRAAWVRNLLTSL